MVRPVLGNLPSFPAGKRSLRNWPFKRTSLSRPFVLCGVCVAGCRLTLC